MLNLKLSVCAQSGVRAFIFIFKIFDGPNNNGGVFVGIKGETFIDRGNNWYDSFVSTFILVTCTRGPIS